MMVLVNDTLDISTVVRVNLQKISFHYKLGRNGTVLPSINNMRATWSVHANGTSAITKPF